MPYESSGMNINFWGGGGGRAGHDSKISEGGFSDVAAKLLLRHGTRWW